MVELQINSGVEYGRIKDYFERELNYLNEEENVYLREGCKIILEMTPKQIGLLKLPRTLVRFIGEEDICQQEQANFRMRFLSAGG